MTAHLVIGRVTRLLPSFLRKKQSVRNVISATHPGIYLLSRHRRALFPILTICAVIFFLHTIHRQPFGCRDLRKDSRREGTQFAKRSKGITMCLKTECLKACLTAVAVLSSAQIALSDAPTPAAAPGTPVAVVQPSPAFTGNYGFATYPSAVGVAPNCCYSAPAYPVGAYYYPPTMVPYYVPMAVAPVPADPYTYHFGPGNYSSQGAGHYRFPYYSYRRPWYFPGPRVFNRNTDLVW